MEEEKRVDERGADPHCMYFGPGKFQKKKKGHIRTQISVLLAKLRRQKVRGQEGRGWQDERGTGELIGGSEYKPNQEE